MHTAGEVSDVRNWIQFGRNCRRRIGLLGKTGQKAAKLYIEIKSDWLLDCFSLVMKLPGLCFVCFLTLTEILRRLKIILIYAS